MVLIIKYKNGSITADGTATGCKIDGQMVALEVSRMMSYKPYNIDLRDVKTVMVDGITIY